MPIDETQLTWRIIALVGFLIVFSISSCVVHDGLYMANGFNDVALPGKSDPVWTKECQ